MTEKTSDGRPRHPVAPLRVTEEALDAFDKMFIPGVGRKFVEYGLWVIVPKEQV